MNIEYALDCARKCYWEEVNDAPEDFWDWHQIYRDVAKEFFQALGIDLEDTDPKKYVIDWNGITYSVRTPHGELMVSSDGVEWKDPDPILNEVRDDES